MRPFLFEHQGAAPAALELCPRCKTGHLQRSLGRVTCPHHGCADSLDDHGIVYVQADEIRALLDRFEVDPPVVESMDLLIRSALPNRPAEPLPQGQDAKEPPNG